MDSKIYNSLKVCFNATFTGWKRKEKRFEYQKRILEEYPVIGGEAFCAFSQVMEMRENPEEMLQKYFSFLKDIQACVDSGGLTKEKFTEYYENSCGISKQFWEKYSEDAYQRTAVAIPVVILKLYAGMISEPLKKAV